jgi:hypothetical protein
MNKPKINNIHKNYGQQKQLIIQADNRYIICNNQPSESCHGPRTIRHAGVISKEYAHIAIHP